MNGAKQMEETQNGTKLKCLKCQKPAIIKEDKKYYCVKHYCIKKGIVLKK